MLMDGAAILDLEIGIGEVPESGGIPIDISDWGLRNPEFPIQMECAIIFSPVQTKGGFDSNRLNAAYVMASLMDSLRTCMGSVPFKHLLKIQQINFLKISSQVAF